MSKLDAEHRHSDPPHERGKKPLRAWVQQALENYLDDMDGHAPAELYQMVLNEVEPPLLQTVLRYTRGNQSKAAQILGLNRSTLRKKLSQYGLDN
ncbi:MAG: DNA-binding transcriptional regulator Fis [Gammaproteobacteria bacterium]|nr:MAG: DNA-binding transcriptional regulator Fis [Gammaproteobacteria bacterium]